MVLDSLHARTHACTRTHRHTHYCSINPGDSVYLRSTYCRAQTPKRVTNTNIINHEYNKKYWLCLLAMRTLVALCCCSVAYHYIHTYSTPVWAFTIYLSETTSVYQKEWLIALNLHIRARLNCWLCDLGDKLYSCNVWCEFLILLHSHIRTYMLQTEC